MSGLFVVHIEGKNLHFEFEIMIGWLFWYVYLNKVTNQMIFKTWETPHDEEMTDVCSRLLLNVVCMSRWPTHHTDVCRSIKTGSWDSEWCHRITRIPEKKQWRIKQESKEKEEFELANSNCPFHCDECLWWCVIQSLNTNSCSSICVGQEGKLQVAF